MICKLDGNNWCERHKATHKGRVLTLSQEDSPNGEATRLAMDRAMLAPEKKSTTTPHVRVEAAARRKLNRLEVNHPKQEEPVQGMGDALKAVLDMTGITQERVKAVLGSCEGCPARQAMLNQLGWAAMRVLRGAKDAVVHFKQMLGEEEGGK